MLILSFIRFVDNVVVTSPGTTFQLPTSVFHPQELAATTFNVSFVVNNRAGHQTTLRKNYWPLCTRSNTSTSSWHPVTLTALRSRRKRTTEVPRINWLKTLKNFSALLIWFRLMLSLKMTWSTFHTTILPHCLTPTTSLHTSQQLETQRSTTF